LRLRVVEDASQEEQRMHDDVSRLVGIEGLVVTGVLDHGWWVELEVELVARAGCCRWWARGSLTVKDRSVVRVRDLEEGTVKIEATRPNEWGRANAL
jgi:hypothetical protein